MGFLLRDRKVKGLRLGQRETASEPILLLGFCGALCSEDTLLMRDTQADGVFTGLCEGTDSIQGPSKDLVDTPRLVSYLFQGVANIA